MSHRPVGSDYDSPSRLFGGAARAPNRRLHAVARPYSRPASYTGPSASTQNGHADPSTALSPFSRMGPPGQASESNGGGRLKHSVSTSTMSSGMTRSGSEPSLSTTASGGLFNGIKSMFSRPFHWLATPSKGTRREQDVEDQESPVVMRRHHTMTNGDTSPAVPRQRASGQMLPPLPPHVSLSRPSTTNFSRPLQSMRSLPHLDPPRSLVPSPTTHYRSSGVLTRSNRANIGVSMDAEPVGDGGGSPEAWSPWKDRQTRATTPQRGLISPTTTTRSAKRSSTRDYALPSMSPFRPTRSPSQRANGLSRSNTTANTTNFGRAGSVMSDVSMGRESVKSGRSFRRGGSMMIESQPRRGEENMSVDGDRPGGSGMVCPRRLGPTNTRRVGSHRSDGMGRRLAA